ncbi:AsnC family [Cedecea neteri]|uniref:AsnC family n=1 Tax=Cedecea neteri TaxID=158822 RepID=A0A2X3IYT2_9ENTR|nr:AsnC family [Cedecea neteri]
MIQQTAALLDPKAISNPCWRLSTLIPKAGEKRRICCEFPPIGVEEIHSVAGDTSMLLKVRTEDSRALEALLAHLYEINGVVATRTTSCSRPIWSALSSRALP